MTRPAEEIRGYKTLYRRGYGFLLHLSAGNQIDRKKLVNMMKEETTVTISSDKEVTVTPRYKGGCPIKFNFIGKIDDRNPKSINGRKAYTQSTKSELYVLELVDKLMDKTTNRVIIRPKNYNKTEKERIKTGTRKLQDRSLLIRTKYQHYIVNPYFFVPQREYQRRVLLKWQEALRLHHQ